MMTSFASPERVPQHAICRRGIVRSQTAGYPDIRNGTRSSHPNRIGSRPSIESLSFLPSRSLGTGQLAGDVQRFYSHALRHRPTSRQGTHRSARSRRAASPIVSSSFRWLSFMARLCRHISSPPLILMPIAIGWPLQSFSSGWPSNKCLSLD